MALFVVAGLLSTIAGFSLGKIIDNNNTDEHHKHTPKTLSGGSKLLKSKKHKRKHYKNEKMSFENFKNFKNFDNKLKNVSKEVLSGGLSLDSVIPLSTFSTTSFKPKNKQENENMQNFRNFEHFHNPKTGQNSGRKYNSNSTKTKNIKKSKNYTISNNIQSTLEDSNFVVPPDIKPNTFSQNKNNLVHTHITNKNIDKIYQINEQDDKNLSNVSSIHYSWL